MFCSRCLDIVWVNNNYCIGLLSGLRVSFLSVDSSELLKCLAFGLASGRLGLLEYCGAFVLRNQPQNLYRSKDSLGLGGLHK
jgi:hypothetical protein